MNSYFIRAKLYKIDQQKKEQKEVLKEVNKADQKSDQDKLIKLEIQRKAEIAERQKNEVRASSRIQDTNYKCKFHFIINSVNDLNIVHKKKLSYEKTKSFK